MRLLDPRSAAQEHVFGENECLYLDHRGNRVLADAEGDGWFWIDQAPTGATLQIDGQVRDALNGRFEHSLLLSSPDSGVSAVRILMGGVPSPNEPGSLFVDEVSGSGWVINASGLIEVDHSGEWAPTPRPQFGIPFLLNARSSKPFRAVLNRGERVEVIDRLAVGDLDSLKAHNWSVQNMSRTEVLDSRFSNGAQLVAEQASHLNAATWVSLLPEKCAGVRISKIYDRFHGRQRARVMIDGEFAGWWYCPKQDRQSRWAVSSFGIMDRYIQGKAQIQVSLDPPAGSPLWSWSSMDILAFVPEIVDHSTSTADNP